MDTTIFTISGFDISTTQLLLCGIVVSACIWVFMRLHKYSFFESTDSAEPEYRHGGFPFWLGISLFFACVLIILRILNIDFIIFDYSDFSVTINHIAEILSLFSLALLFDWIISHVVIRNKFSKRETPVKTKVHSVKTNELKATRQVRYIVYLYIFQILIKRLGFDIVLMQREIKGELFSVHFSDLIMAVMIILIARVIIWFITQVSLYRMYLNNDMDEGIQFAINQLVTYVIYVIAFLFALDHIISDMSIIYGGAAALLVGVGLGLQQTFNDFFSGLVLLFERSVMVGDVLELDGQVGRVLKIGLRASRIETRNSVSMLVPNSKLVNQSVVNWTHFDNIVRFDIGVSVAYGSDPVLVQELLLQSLLIEEFILKEPVPFVRLNDFGESGLNFSLYFFTNEVMAADDLKSKVRFEIDRLFRQHHIQIPFPQRDVWLRQEAIKNNQR